MGRVKIVECPRDAWQGLPKAIPAEIKADYLRALVAAGFRHIDAVSFVSKAAIPQMADSEMVLEFLDLPGLGGETAHTQFHQPTSKVTSLHHRQPTDLAPDAEDAFEILGIVVNRQGAERAAETGRVQAVGFPYSVSETFLKRNQNQTPEESIEALEEVSGVAQRAGLELVGYCSMAFGNPYSDPWSVAEVVTACELMVESGAGVISLADTIGLATPRQVRELVEAVIGSVGSGKGAVEVGVHLHARPEGAAEKIRAAYEAGCRRFDAAIGGFGGCPFAQDALVGNLATETLLLELGRLGAELPLMVPLDGLVKAGAAIQKRYGSMVQ